MPLIQGLSDALPALLVARWGQPTKRTATALLRPRLDVFAREVDACASRAVVVTQHAFGGWLQRVYRGGDMKLGKPGRTCTNLIWGRL